MTKVKTNSKVHRLLIDNYTTEDDYNIYFVADYDEYIVAQHKAIGEKRYVNATQFPSELCSDTGWFHDEDGVQEFLDEHKGEFEIVEDYR